jgi:hypothetical protein
MTVAANPGTRQTLPVADLQFLRAGEVAQNPLGGDFFACAFEEWCAATIASNTSDGNDQTDRAFALYDHMMKWDANTHGDIARKLRVIAHMMRVADAEPVEQHAIASVLADLDRIDAAAKYVTRSRRSPNHAALLHRFIEADKAHRALPDGEESEAVDRAYQTRYSAFDLLMNATKPQTIGEAAASMRVALAELPD